MNITIRDIGDQKKEARIKVEWDRVQADYEDIIGDYMKLPVPGFRPGKAPKARVEKQYQREILDDVGIRCAGRFSRQALDDEGISMTGPIAVTDLIIEHGEPIRFTAEFLELADFDLPDYGRCILKKETDEGRRDEISLWLLEQTTLEVPDELVRQELLFDGITEAQPSGEEWGAALSRVKLLLILDRIARRDGIETDDRDVEQRIDQIASANEMQPQLLKQRLLRDGGVSRLSRFLLAEKTLDYLIETCGNRAINDSHS